MTMTPCENIDIRHEPERGRFLATVDGYPCYVLYSLDDHTMSITSTQVPSAVGNRGIAAALTEEALRYAEANALKVNPVCPYTAAYLRRRKAPTAPAL